MEKNILGPNSADSGPRQENSEKNSKKLHKIKKTSFWHYSQPKLDEIGREREKKILVPNSVYTRPGSKIPKKIAKKFKKSKNLFPTIFRAKTG